MSLHQPPNELINRGTASSTLLLTLLSVVSVLVLGWAAIALRPDARKSSGSQAAIEVYCAAGLVTPVERAIRRYNPRRGAQVVLARIGGSGELAGQIRAEWASNASRRADLFISADEQLLIEARRAGVVNKFIPLAVQEPVIVTPVDSGLEIGGLEELVDRTDLRFGVASERAAIGKLVREIAKRDGVLLQLEANKLTDAENVMMLAQALITGSLDAAVLWDTTVNQLNHQYAQPRLRIEAPADRLRKSVGHIAIGVISTTRHPADSIEFARYLLPPNDGWLELELDGFKSRVPK